MSCGKSDYTEYHNIINNYNNKEEKEEKEEEEEEEEEKKKKKKKEEEKEEEEEEEEEIWVNWFGGKWETDIFRNNEKSFMWIVLLMQVIDLTYCNKIQVQ